MTEERIFTQLVMYNVKLNKIAVLTSSNYGWSCDYGQSFDDGGISLKHAINAADFDDAVIDPAWTIVGAL